uniref:Uncharacterized protein n=1 Tax=Knipowitschia caucasica TaxID=637954 RepID=A0AAV2K677_KNICA
MMLVEGGIGMEDEGRLVFVGLCVGCLGGVGFFWECCGCWFVFGDLLGRSVGGGGGGLCLEVGWIVYCFCGGGLGGFRGVWGVRGEGVGCCGVGWGGVVGWGGGGGGGVWGG